MMVGTDLNSFVWISKSFLPRTVALRSASTPSLKMMNLTKIRLSARNLQRLMNWWPPMSLGPGIRVDSISEDFRNARVSLPLRFYNQNYVGCHFGGSLYSMTDPMYMLMLLNILGPDFVVWDKAAKIEYKKPGKGRVTADFHVPETLISSLKTLEPNEKRILDFMVEVKDDQGEVVANVIKTEYIRRKSLER